MPVRIGRKLFRKTGAFGFAPLVSADRTANPSMAARSKLGRLTGERISFDKTRPDACILGKRSVLCKGKQRSRSISFAAAAPRKRLNMQKSCQPFLGYMLLYIFYISCESFI
jgi:hypothetical protein